jgi:8-oxo-dGTP pyrophosphatase MutT (NUDIX family)
MLIADGRVLAEQRKLTKSLAPGAVALPGGHLEGNEDRKDALERELREELGIVAHRVAYVPIPRSRGVTVGGARRARSAGSRYRSGSRS